MRDEPVDGVVANPWARRPGDLAEVAEHRAGDWGDDPVVPVAALSGPPPVSPARTLRPARVAVILASVLSGVELLGTVWAYTETRGAIADDPAGSEAPLESLQLAQDAIDRLNASTGLTSVLAIVSVLALLVAAIFVLRWQAVVVGNQRGLGVANPRYSPVGAGWSWFVPIWALFGPKRALNDAWRAADPAAGGAEPSDRWLKRPVSPLLNWWWGAWLVGVVVGRGIGSIGSETLGDASTLYAVSMVSCVALIVAGVLFVVVMEQLTARQDARIAERRA